MELFFKYDIWKILAGVLIGGLGKTIWDHYVKRVKVREMVAREIKSQLDQRPM